jgi:hypothetical protein
MIRKRNDSVKDGCGDSGTEGQTFTKDHAFNDVNFGYPGRDKRERSVSGAYTRDDDAGLVRRDDFEHSAGSRQIWSDVEQNSDTVDDNHNAITHGVDRGQS